jgi:hypothetical protein
MVAANVPMTIRYKLFPKAFEYATDTDGLQVTTIDGLTTTQYKHFCGKNPNFAQHLRTWGEARTVKTKTKTTPKIADRGVQCMFIGYSKDHEGDCYQMWNPRTEGVHTTRDAIWLRRMFYVTLLLRYRKSRSNHTMISLSSLLGTKKRMQIQTQHRQGRVLMMTIRMTRKKRKCRN